MQKELSSTTFTLPDQPDYIYKVVRGPDPELELPDSWITVTAEHVSEMIGGEPRIVGSPIGFAGPA